ncbi:MAG: hypothetical protein OEM22_05555, partial [Acidimicrobiia bacterium]|nr:hypothetical protein [Acidimicrobiia bacterium]
GPAKVGKATVARRFAAAVLCGDDSECLRRAVGGFHPDLTVVEPDGVSSLTVDQSRSTVAQAALAPLEGMRKVFLFEEAGLMNDEAANALLKTLEEPTTTTHFVLVAESEDELPATVSSRARTIRFGRVGHDELVGALQGMGVPAQQAADAARISGGRPGLALSLATQPDVAEFRRTWLSIPTRVSPSPGEAYRLAAEVMDAAEPLLGALKLRHEDEAGSSADRQQRELKRATSALHVNGLEILASWYRDVAAAQFGAEVRNHDVPAASLTALTPAIAVARAERVLDTIDVLAANQRPQLAFAALFADLGADA